MRHTITIALHTKPFLRHSHYSRQLELRAHTTTARAKQSASSQQQQQQNNNTTNEQVIASNYLIQWYLQLQPSVPATIFISSIRIVNYTPCFYIENNFQFIFIENNRVSCTSTGVLKWWFNIIGKQIIYSFVIIIAFC